MRIIRISLLIITLGLFMSCVSIMDHFVGNMISSGEEKNRKILSEQIVPENIVEITNIPYIINGHKRQVLDIYYPENMTVPFPVIINIHGGGFLSEDKELNKLFCFNLAKNGFIVFNLNFRLAYYDTTIPGQIDDIINAINWIGDNIEFYPANKQKIYLIGNSSGGYLATMTVLISSSERLRNIFNAQELNLPINAMAINCGLMELEKSSIAYWGMRSMVLEKGYEKQEYYRNLILKNIPEIINLPPVFLTTNWNDELEFMTLYFEKILNKNNMEYLLYYIGENDSKRVWHTFNLFHLDWEESIKLNNAMLEYLLKF